MLLIALALAVSFGLGTPVLPVGTSVLAVGTPIAVVGTPTLALGTPAIAPGIQTTALGTSTVALATPTIAPSIPTIALGTPTAAVPTATPQSLLPRTQPGLDADEGVFFVTAGDDGSSVVYFVAQNARHSTLPADLHAEQQLNPLWPVRLVDRDVVLAFAEAAPVGTARLGLLSAPVAADPSEDARTPPTVLEDAVGGRATVADAQPVVAEAALAYLAYTVRAGDTLIRLSARNGTTVQTIVDANGITDPNLIYIGQTINIPGPSAAPHLADHQPVADQPTSPEPASLGVGHEPAPMGATSPQPPDDQLILAPPRPTPSRGLPTPSESAAAAESPTPREPPVLVESPASPEVARVAESPASPASATSAAGTPAVGQAGTPAVNPAGDAEPLAGLSASGQPSSYTVKRGESAVSISRQFGVDLEVLLSINAITDRNLLLIGQVLAIP